MWCHSKVIFIPKAGKASYLEPRSFRPISLANYLYKALEVLAVWRVEETALQSSPLHRRQFAFRKDHSTDQALTESVNVIEKAMLRGLMAIAIYIDIKGAFDNICTNAIVDSLTRRGVEEQIVSWYRNYLTQRTCETTLGGSTSKASLTRGAPQGGPGSPELSWNIPYDDLLREYNQMAAEQFGFADDTKLVITGCDFDTIMREAQKAIKVAEKWALDKGVQFCTNKTQVLFFTRGLWRPQRKLKLYGKELPWSSDTKYLGVTIDDKLTFRKHIQNRIASAKRKLMILRNALARTWAPNHPFANGHILALFGQL